MRPLQSRADAEADRIASKKAERFVNDLIARGTAIGLKFGQIAQRVEDDNSFDGILAEISSREAAQESRRRRGAGRTWKAPRLLGFIMRMRLGH